MKHVVLYAGHLYQPFWTLQIWPGWQPKLGIGTFGCCWPLLQSVVRMLMTLMIVVRMMLVMIAIIMARMMTTLVRMQWMAGTLNTIHWGIKGVKFLAWKSSGVIFFDKSHVCNQEHDQSLLWWWLWICWWLLQERWARLLGYQCSAEAGTLTCQIWDCRSQINEWMRANESKTRTSELRRRWWWFFF